MQCLYIGTIKYTDLFMQFEFCYRQLAVIARMSVIFYFLFHVGKIVRFSLKFSLAFLSIILSYLQATMELKINTRWFKSQLHLTSLLRLFCVLFFIEAPISLRFLFSFRILLFSLNNFILFFFHSFISNSRLLFSLQFFCLALFEVFIYMFQLLPSLFWWVKGFQPYYHHVLHNTFLSSKHAIIMTRLISKLINTKPEKLCTK